MPRKALSLSSRRTAVGCSAAARRCLRRRADGGEWCEELDGLEIAGGFIGGSLYDALERQYGVSAAAGTAAPTDRAAAEVAAADQTLDAIDALYRGTSIVLAEDAVRLASRAAGKRGWARAGLYVAAFSAGLLSIASGMMAGVPRGCVAASLVPQEAPRSARRIRNPSPRTKRLD
ncbi:MAG: hypothetical protein ACYS0K_23150 [Planctomycetota bacterium]